MLPEGAEETAWAEEEDDEADDREEDDAPAEARLDTPCAGDRSWRLSEKRGFTGWLSSSSLLLSRRSIECRERKRAHRRLKAGSSLCEVPAQVVRRRRAI